MTEEHTKYVKTLGKLAKIKGLPESANPYIVGNKDCELWLEGWREAIAPKAKSPAKRKKSK